MHPHWFHPTCTKPVSYFDWLPQAQQSRGRLPNKVQQDLILHLHLSQRSGQRPRHWSFVPRKWFVQLGYSWLIVRRCRQVNTFWRRHRSALCSRCQLHYPESHRSLRLDHESSSRFYGCGCSAKFQLSPIYVRGTLRSIGDHLHSQR